MLVETNDDPFAAPPARQYLVDSNPRLNALTRNCHLTKRRVRPCVMMITFRSSLAMFSLAKSLNMVAMNDVALLYTSNPDSPCGNLVG